MTPFLDLGLATQQLRGELDAAVRRVFDSGRYIGGEEVEAFEREFAAYTGEPYVVGTGSGLDALTLMLRAYEIGPGDEVIVPSNTYIATWLAVSQVGARIVPVEPELRTYNLDPALVAAAITGRTRAILAVHLYGRCAEMAALRSMANRAGLLLLADAAQAHGLRGPLGQAGADASAFSFYPSKNLGALGDAGAVATSDEQVAQKIRVLGNYGSREKYVNDLRGVNSRLDPLQAAILRVKLRVLDTWNDRRRAIAQEYVEALSGIPELVLPLHDEGGDNVWHIFPLRHPERDRLARQLAAAGVGTLIHYPQPPHLSGAYREAGYGLGDFPLAERIASTELSLPLHPHLNDAQIDTVITAVRRASCLAAGAA